MSLDPIAPPDGPAHIIYVGQDAAGHWLVQDSGGKLEGRFVSRGAAWSFARAERDIYHAGIEIAAVPLVPLISFEPAAPDDCAWSHDGEER